MLKNKGLLTNRPYKHANPILSVQYYSGYLQLDVLLNAQRRKVHADDNGAIVLLTNHTSFKGIVYIYDTKSAYSKSAFHLCISIID